MENLIPVIGMIFIAVSLYLFKREREFIANSIKTEALVVEMKEEFNNSTDSNDRYVYYPVFEFVDIYGKTIRKKHKRGSNPPAYQMYNRVKIQYDPNKSENFKIESDNNQ